MATILSQKTLDTWQLAHVTAFLLKTFHTLLVHVDDQSLWRFILSHLSDHYTHNPCHDWAVEFWLSGCWIESRLCLTPNPLRTSLDRIPIRVIMLHSSLAEHRKKMRINWMFFDSLEHFCYNFRHKLQLFNHYGWNIRIRCSVMWDLRRLGVFTKWNVE